MSITGFIVLYAVIWFITLWCVLPVGIKSQHETGEIVPGTQSGAPANLRMGRKLLWTTIIGTLVWAAIAGAIAYSGLTIYDIDPWRWFGFDNRVN